MCATQISIINDITTNLKKEFKKCLLLLVSETYHPTKSKSWFIKQWLIQKSILNQKFRDSLHLTIPSTGNTEPWVSWLFGCAICWNISQPRNMLLGPRSNSVMYFASQFFCRDKKKVPSKLIFSFWKQWTYILRTISSQWCYNHEWVELSACSFFVMAYQCLHFQIVKKSVLSQSYVKEQHMAPTTQKHCLNFSCITAMALFGRRWGSPFNQSILCRKCSIWIFPTLYWIFLKTQCPFLNRKISVTFLRFSLPSGTICVLTIIFSNIPV